ncbi:DUF3015 family protein [Chitinimonas sp. BJYL2]|uniref:DUF3015 family protein n=1 Tax=Chitinimonas sp. BJYL2 TaxID=2976696 RepID=UPI0022B3B867|nr:DUF3015 family protein [Chitinimonas sp. BJYL2]
MKTNTLVASLFAGAVFAVAAPAQAAGRDFGAIYTDCGLGGLMAPNTAWAAVITNITWDWGTTAISSELSTAESCKGGKKEKTAAFILQSYAELEKDLAQGQGAHLNALVALSGCQESVRADLIKGVRADLATRVAAPEYSNQTRAQQAEGLYNAVQNRVEGDLASSCNANVG